MDTLFFPDIDAPISQGAGNAEALLFVDQSKVDTLLSFGFQEDIARKALKANVKFLYLLSFFGYGGTSCVNFHVVGFGVLTFWDWQGGNIELATEWILENPDAVSSSDMDATSSSAPTADARLPDGGGS